MRCAHGILAVLAVTCALALPSPASAQTTKPTYGVATVLEFPTGTRAVGMGETGVADNTDPANIWFNPANVVAPARVYLRGSYWDWSPSDVTHSTGSAGGSWRGTAGSRPVAFGVDFSTGKFGTHTEIITIFLPEGAGETDPAEYFWALTGGAGVILDDRWDVRVGAAARRYWREGLDGFGFDAGTTVAYRAVASEWQVRPAAAVAFVNLGSELQETDTFIQKLPARFNYGLSLRIESHAVRVMKASVPLLAMTCSVDGVDRFYGWESSWSLGSEFALADILFLRAGTTHDETLRNWRSAGSPFSSLGVGLAVPIQSFRLRFDYARMPRLTFPDRYGLYAVVSI
ncbi:MAG TPA: hypothetical protein VFT13_03075 [Candidatus Krumholzibacteria bacterium]|nr:hypothetical protein [Candidatus Krumholzibacteria bacterium]